MSILRWLFKKERRKDHELRQIIDERNQAAEEFKEVADKLIATINGDLKWFDMQYCKDEEPNHGHGSDPVCDSNNLCHD